MELLHDEITKMEVRIQKAFKKTVKDLDAKLRSILDNVTQRSKKDGDEDGSCSSGPAEQTDLEKLQRRVAPKVIAWKAQWVAPKSKDINSDMVMEGGDARADENAESEDENPGKGKNKGTKRTAMKETEKSTVDKPEKIVVDVDENEEKNPNKGKKRATKKSAMDEPEEMDVDGDESEEKPED